MAKKKTTKRRVSMSPALGAPYGGKNNKPFKFVTECPKCSKVYTPEDINGGRCAKPNGCGTMIDDPYARAWSTMKNAAKEAAHQKLKEDFAALQKKFNKLDRVIVSIYNNMWAEEDDDGNVTLNPDKEWDSAADFMEHVADQLNTIMPRPKKGSTDAPEYKK